jgi:hypothetical protein
LKQKKTEVETLTVLVDRATTMVEKLRNAKQQYHHCRTSYQEESYSATQEEYLLAKFLYTIDDTYECPQGETLKLREDGKKPAQSKVDTNLRNTVLQLVACPNIFVRVELEEGNR